MAGWRHARKIAFDRTGGGSKGDGNEDGRQNTRQCRSKPHTCMLHRPVNPAWRQLLHAIAMERLRGTERQADPHVWTELYFMPALSM